jgi:Flp pilus assembly protein TadG
MLSKHIRRRGVAAVEFALLAPVLLILLGGLWEVGRLVEVKQVMDNAAREGARLAAQAQIIAPIGGFTQIHTSTGVPNVQDTVREYLFNAGIVDSNTKNDVQVQFAFLDGDLTRTDPYQGLKGERFQVTVTMPFQDVNWTLWNTNGINLVAQVTWVIVVDNPFTVNTTIPGWNP